MIDDTDPDDLSNPLYQVDLKVGNIYIIFMRILVTTINCHYHM